ncbi:hypothetical protein N7G274_007263 [Stereocaulon virgatum]|uniref:Ankyrin repeat protein n=1 Tax=Stereocaulon virgatum TaxID=373712 RepID=A0ABR4A1N5_9LECA
MAELAMIIGLIDGSAGLLIKCGSVVNTLSNLAGKFKKAELAIKTMIQQVDTIKAAWSRIREWSIECQKNEDARRSGLELLGRLNQSLECGDLVISALEEDLVPYRNAKKTMSLRQRSKSIWNENLLHLHRDRVRDQVLTMNLLLQVLQLPTSEHRINLLRESELELRQYDESAFSIVPSRMSSRMSVSTYRKDTNTSVECVDMVYKPLSFENDLFTATVYKRNYRSPLSGSVIHSKIVAAEAANQPHRMRRNSATKVEEAEVVEDTSLTQPNPVQELMARARPGYKPVHAVAMIGNIELMEELLAGGAIVNEYTADGLKLAPLHIATNYGHEPMTRLLLRKGAHVDSSDSLGNRPIQYAIHGRNLEVVRILLDYGAATNGASQCHYQPLHHAAHSCEQPNMIELVSSRGLNINEKDWAIRTPLHLACEQGNVLNIHILLASYTRAGLELPDDILFTAIGSAKPSAVEEFLEQGLVPDIDSKTYRGFKTALHYALLLFASTTATGKDSFFAKHRKDFKAIVQILLKYKANICATGEYGSYLFHSLMEQDDRNEEIINQSQDLLNLLLNGGAISEALHKFRMSLLWGLPSCRMVHFVLSRGAEDLSESQLKNFAMYFKMCRDFNIGSITQADAKKMMEFLAKKAAEPIWQPSVPTPALLANQTSEHKDKET